MTNDALESKVPEFKEFMELFLNTDLEPADQLTIDNINEAFEDIEIMKGEFCELRERVSGLIEELIVIQNINEEKKAHKEQEEEIKDHRSTYFNNVI